MSKRNHISTLFLSLLMPLGLWNVYAQNVDLESLGKGKFKSFNTETWANTTQEIDQVIGQKGAFGNINNLTKFEWIAEASRGNDITVLNELWKNVFQTKKTEIFNAMNNNLKYSLQIDDAADLTSSKIDEILNIIIKVQ